MSVIDLSAVRAERARAADEVLARARVLLGRRALSTVELQSLLQREGYDATDAHAAVVQLEADLALDDAALAVAIIERMQSRKGSSWRAITMELQRRKIDQEHWGERPDGDAEFERALEAVSRRIRSVVDDDQRSRKLQAWLGRRGFDGAVSRRAVEAAIERDRLDAVESQ